MAKNKFPKPKVYFKKISFCFLVIYIIGCLTIILPDYRAYGFLYYRFIPNTTKIDAVLEVSTGPLHYVSEDDLEVRKMIDEIYPGINTYEIELEGYTPYDLVDDAAEIGDLTVYGYFNGETDLYRSIGYGDIPVFDVKYYDCPSMLLSENSTPPWFSAMVVTFPAFVVILLIYVVHYGRKLVLKLVHIKQ